MLEFLMHQANFNNQSDDAYLELINMNWMNWWCGLREIELCRKCFKCVTFMMWVCFFCNINLCEQSIYFFWSQKTKG